MLVLGSIALFLGFVNCCFGQTTNATCSSAYEWAVNGNQQSPCLVGAYLESQCLPNVSVPALPDPEQVRYTGPSFATANVCTCSTVTYSLLAACGACQGHVWEDWGNWSINCIQVEIAEYPRPVPAGVDIPLWAYLNVTQMNNTFDPGLAQENATTPLSTSSLPSTVPTTIATTSGSSSHNVSAGVIAGAVVGGLAGAVVLGLAIWFYIHRHRSIGKPKPVYGDADLNGGGVPLSPYTDHLLLSSENTSPTMLPVAHHYDGMSERTLRSISPVSPITSGIYTTFGGRTSSDTIPRPLSGYSGVPEV